MKLLAPTAFRMYACRRRAKGPSCQMANGSLVVSASKTSAMAEYSMNLLGRCSYIEREREERERERGERVREREIERKIERERDRER